MNEVDVLVTELQEKIEQFCHLSPNEENIQEYLMFSNRILEIHQTLNYLINLGVDETDINQLEGYLVEITKMLKNW